MSHQEQVSNSGHQPTGSSRRVEASVAQSRDTAAHGSSTSRNVSAGKSHLSTNRSADPSRPLVQSHSSKGEASVAQSYSNSSCRNHVSLAKSKTSNSRDARHSQSAAKSHSGITEALPTQSQGNTVNGASSSRNLSATKPQPSVSSGSHSQRLPLAKSRSSTERSVGGNISEVRSIAEHATSVSRNPSVTGTAKNPSYRPTESECSNTRQAEFRVLNASYATSKSKHTHSVLDSNHSTATTISTSAQTNDDSLTDDSIAATRDGLRSELPRLATVHVSNMSGVVEVTDKYILRHDVIPGLSAMVKHVLAPKTLPFTPYSELRQLALARNERLRMGDVPNQPGVTAVVDAAEGLGLLVSDSRKLVWGLKQIVQWTVPEQVADLSWLIESLAADAQAMIPAKEDFDSQVVSAVRGNFVFMGLVKETLDLHIQLDYLLWGPDLDKGIDLFTTAVVDDIITMHSTSPHIVISVKVTGEQDTVHIWYISGILKKKDEFREAVNKSTQFQVSLKLECFFGTSPCGPPYEHGTKSYQLNFVRTSDQAENEKLIVCDRHTLNTLHTSVFVNQTMATSYLAMFLPPNEEESDAILQADNPRGRYIHPFQSAVTGSLRSVWKNRLASLSETDLISNLHMILYDMAINTSAEYPPDLLPSITMLSRSTAAKLQHTMSLLQAASMAIKHVPNDTLVEGKMADCLDSILRRVGREVHQDPKSPRVTSMEEDVVYRMCLNWIPNIRSLSPFSDEVGKGISNIHCALQCLQYSLLEQALASCTELTTYLSHLKVRRAAELAVTKPAVTSQPERKSATRSLSRRSRPVTQQSSADQPPKSAVSHSAKAKEVQHTLPGTKEPRTFDNLVIDTTNATGMETPADMECAVKLQYAADVRLDQVLQHCVLEICCAQILPKSPWSVVSEESLAAYYRFLLQQERFEKTLRTLLYNISKLDVIDEESGLCTLTGTQVFGVDTAIVACNPKYVTWIYELASTLACEDVIVKAARYRVQNAMSLSGFTVFSGSLNPYVNKVTLQEHFYIRDSGSPNEQEVALLFANIIVQDVKQSMKRTGSVLHQLHCHGKSWSSAYLRKLNTASLHRLATEISSDVLSCCKIWTEIYTSKDWRYIRVEKHYIMHWSFDDSSLSTFASTADGNLERCTTVFLNLKQAVAHNRRVHAREDDDLDGDDSAMMRSALNALWTKLKGLVRTGTGEALAEAVNCIALKSLIFKQHSSSLLLECWRIYQSLLSTLLYLKCLCEDAMMLLGDLQEQGTTDPQPGHLTVQPGSNPETVISASQLADMIIVFKEKCCSSLSDSFFQMSTFQLQALKDNFAKWKTQPLDLTQDTTAQKMLDDLQQIDILLDVKRNEIVQQLLSTSPLICNDLLSAGWKGKVFRLPPTEAGSAYNSMTGTSAVTSFNISRLSGSLDLSVTSDSEDLSASPAVSVRDEAVK